MALRTAESPLTEAQRGMGRSTSVQELPQNKEYDPTTKVVVIGMGAVTPLGIGVEAMWDGLINGRSGIVERDYSNYKEEHYPQIKAKVAGMVPNEFDPVTLLNGVVARKDINRKLHTSALYSLVAGYEALQQAGVLMHTEDQLGEDGKPDSVTVGRNWKINPDLIDPTQIAAYIGTGIGGAETVADVQRSLERGRPADPSGILKTLAERVATTVSMSFGIEGDVQTPIAACATGNKAIVAGVRAIRSGDVVAALVGGTEAANVPLGSGMFDVLRALSQNEDPEKASRPFDRDRDGFVMGEGAGTLFLVRLDVAQRLKAKILAEVSAYGDFSDAYHDTSPTGKGARLALNRVIDLSDLRKARGPVYTNLHGTSTPEGDPKEAQAVVDVYTERGEVVAGMSSTKSSMGHLLGAAGAVEAIACIKALETQTMPPTLNLDNPIEEVARWNMVAKEAQPAEIRKARNNAFGFGGLNTVVEFTEA